MLTPTQKRIIAALPATTDELARMLYSGRDDERARNNVVVHVWYLERRGYRLDRRWTYVEGKRRLEYRSKGDDK